MREYFVAEFRPHINEYIKDKLEDMVNSSGKKEFLADNIMRITISVRRFVKAIVSANHAIYPNEEMIDKAFEYIQPKMDFLESLSGDDNVEFDLSKKAGIIEFVKMKFAGREFSLNELTEELKNIGVIRSKNTIYRYNREVTVKVRPNYYKLV